MHRDIREDVFDLVFAAALEEYVDNQAEDIPSSQKQCPPKNGLRRIRRAVKAKEHRHSMPVVYLRRVAVVLLVAATAFAGLMATRVEVRAAVKDTVIEWYDKFVRFTFGDETDAVDGLYELEIGYLPDGFEVVNVEETAEYRSYSYATYNGQFIHIRFALTGNTVYYADSEYSEHSIITINGREAYVFYNGTSKGGTVVLVHDNYAISVTGSIDRVELIRITENIK